MAATLEPASSAVSLSSAMKETEIEGRQEIPSGAITPQQDPEKAGIAPGEPEASQPSSPRPYNGWRWLLVCVAIYSTAFLYGLDTTIVANIQAPVVETFGEVEKLGWLGIGFALGSIASILSLGKAFGIFDVKWLYIASIVLFEAGSALCGGSPTMNALIVGRVLAGAGGAGMYLGVLNIITINTSERERPLYMSFTGLVWGSGCIVGPVIGGAFADSGATWRWAFYINLLLFAVASPVYFFILDSFEPQPNTTLLEKLKHVDWVGVFLNAAIYTFFVCAFTFSGAQWKWNSAGTITMFVLFGVSVAAFAVQQGVPLFTTVERRLFPVDFLKRRTLLILYFATSAAATGLFVPLYYIPLFFAFTRGDSGLQGAVRLLPLICVMIFSIMVNGALMPKFGFYQPWYIVAGIFLTIGGALMYSLVDATTTNSKIYGISVIIAIGAGLSQQAAYSVAPVKVAMNRTQGPARIPDAIGFINVAQIGAIVISLTITSTVFQNIGYKHISEALTGLNFTSTDIHAALAGAKSAIFTSPDVTPEIKAKVVEGIVKAISDGYILVITAGAVLLISSLFMRWERLFMEAGAGA